VRGPIVQYEYPPDPPLVASMRQRLGTQRVIVPPKQAPRAPVYGALSALRAWQKENEAREALEAISAESGTHNEERPKPIT
jgi:hypothetical protein